MSSVWVVQPYVPGYRVPFFESLAADLATSDVELNVVAGRARDDQLLRGDAAHPDWLHVARDRQLRAFGRTVTLTSTRRYWRSAAAVVVPHMGSSLDALSALVVPASAKVGVWGHIAPYVSPPHPLDAAIEQWQLRRADRVFAYTPGGADFAVRAGVDPIRVTTVMNATNSEDLGARLEAIGGSDTRAFRSKWRLPAGPIVCYVGGLDATKRIALLARALDVLFAKGSNLHLVVAGNGAQVDLLADAVSRGQATLVGHVVDDEKARLLAMSHAIACPGRVGLVAVDGLVAGIPVVTTASSYHAPEIEYLREGESLVTTRDRPSDYAAALERIAEMPRRDGQWNYPTLAGMVANFSAGIREMLSERSRGR
ncbi:glycosyltransferase [Microbacter sp. GSS18]|nr:glycosyltransferase [Microbacter sp. GSS18]